MSVMAEIFDRMAEKQLRINVSQDEIRIGLWDDDAIIVIVPKTKKLYLNGDDIFCELSYEKVQQIANVMYVIDKNLTEICGWADLPF